MSESNTSSSSGSMVLTFIAGAALGAVVMALTTPKTGPELRGELKGLARRTKRKVGEYADDADTALTDLKDRAVLAVEDLKRGMTDAANDLRG